LAVALLTASCGGEDPSQLLAEEGTGGGSVAAVTASTAGSGGSVAAATTGTGGAGDGGSAPAITGVAPEGAVDGELLATDGDNPVTAGAGSDAVLRVEVVPGEHVGLMLTFAPGAADGIELHLERWNGTEPVELAYTDAGPGLRTLAAMDQAEPRTFWARVTVAGGSFTGNLAVTRTPFEDGLACEEDCARLLQLPAANDPAVDGYAHAETTVFRYQFGRRDMLMFIRYAGMRAVAEGKQPFVPEDLSQWDGKTPGVDVGAPRHASHQRGKDVDISLYGADGLAPWRSYCEVAYTSAGRECKAGTVTNFDGRANAEMFAAFLESERVTMSFLDFELIKAVRSGADAAAAAATIEPGFVPLFKDGEHLQHWPNHDNHIHVRFSEDEYAGGNAFVFDGFEPP
jgi:hypothetical protein